MSSLPPKVDFMHLKNVKSDEQAFDIHTFKNAFWDASASAFHKLQEYAQTSTDTSEGFCEFVTSLGSLEDVHLRGFDVLRNVMEGHCPADVHDIYVLLHVAYAVSQSELVEPLNGSSVEFWDGVQIFRNMLLPVPHFTGGGSQRDIFDRLVELMAEEFECAILWMRKNSCASMFAPVAPFVVSSDLNLSTHNSLAVWIRKACMIESSKYWHQDLIVSAGATHDDPGITDHVNPYNLDLRNKEVSMLFKNTDWGDIISMPIYQGLVRFFQGIYPDVLSQCSCGVTLKNLFRLVVFRHHIFLLCCVIELLRFIHHSSCYDEAREKVDGWTHSMSGTRLSHTIHQREQSPKASAS
ncbi:hypothetical protein TWF694_004717 [Orbilia ellipsospora]|uniref:Uncharacterized protein n=1 Tax=Orbilia ellipsospora TaxID=2528407 RepID=A0AAV9WXD5_9PEZI